MDWVAEYQRDMQLLLSTVEAVVHAWQATHTRDDQTQRWIEDVSALLGVLSERQAYHFGLEDRWLVGHLSRLEFGEILPDLRPLLDEHSDLAASTQSTRQALRALGPTSPAAAKAVVLELLVKLQRHERAESAVLLKAPSRHRAGGDHARSPQAEGRLRKRDDLLATSETP